MITSLLVLTREGEYRRGWITFLLKSVRITRVFARQLHCRIQHGCHIHPHWHYVYNMPPKSFVTLYLRIWTCIGSPKPGYLRNANSYVNLSTLHSDIQFFKSASLPMHGCSQIQTIVSCSFLHLLHLKAPTLVLGMINIWRTQKDFLLLLLSIQIFCDHICSSKSGRGIAYDQSGRI